MRFFYLLFGTYLFFSFLAQAQELCPVRNHIFLIHGIGGNAKSFGELESYLRKLDECYAVRSFEYETGNSALSTQDFAERFHQFVDSKISTGELRALDQISLIMHSQGGIVGNFWLNAVRESNPSLYHQVDAFITLSTPHWGSELAHAGGELLFAIPKGHFGKVELNEMSYGSSSIRSLSAIFTQNFRPRNFRPLAVGGIHKIKNKIIGENDIVVPVYSSRPDHFFSEQLISLQEAAGPISAGTFTKTNRVPFVTVAATHLKMDLPGIASIGSDCLTEQGCDHPSLPFISNHLKGRSIASVAERLDHFRFSLYLSNNSSEKIKTSDVELKVMESKLVTVPLSQKLRHYKGEASLAEGMAFTFHGHTKAPGIQIVRVELRIKNKLTRTIEVPAEGGFSSLLRISLRD